MSTKKKHYDELEKKRSKELEKLQADIDSKSRLLNVIENRIYNGGDPTVFVDPILDGAESAFCFILSRTNDKELATKAFNSYLLGISGTGYKGGIYETVSIEDFKREFDAQNRKEEALHKEVYEQSQDEYYQDFLGIN